MMTRISREEDWYAVSDVYKDGILTKILRVPIPKNKDGSPLTHAQAVQWRDEYLSPKFTVMCDVTEIWRSDS